MVMTEGGGATMLVAHQFPHKLHTVGQPMAGHDIRLIDEDGREVARGRGRRGGRPIGNDDGGIPQPAGKDARGRMA